jgi:phage tail-like protein
MPDPVAGLHFDVVVDGVDLGSFTACEGLGAEVEVFEYQEGGLNDFVHRLPGRLKYAPIKLTRALDAESAGLAAWFSSQKEPSGRKTASITAFDTRGSKVAQWNLVGVYPARWSGPSFSADASGVAKETLELAHNGFMA